MESPSPSCFRTRQRPRSKSTALIELKLASGLSAGHRLRDLADVQDLIVALALPLELSDVLNESVREEYRRLWNLARDARGPG
jgi:hypothetical protein